jgi:hypothetical protein
MKQLIAAAAILGLCAPAMAESTPPPSNAASSTVSGSATADAKFHNPNDEQTDKLAGARPSGPTAQERAANNVRGNGNANLSRGTDNPKHEGATHAVQG